VTVVLELGRETLEADALIEQPGPGWMPPLYEPPGGSPHYPRWIPFVEAWHKGPIPLDAVHRVYAFRAGTGDQYEDVSPIANAVTAAEQLAVKWAAVDEESRRAEPSPFDVGTVWREAQRRRGVV
jgi:hypothetical protein